MAATQRVVRLTPAEALDFFDSLAQRFLRSPATQHIDNRPVVSVLNLPDFAATYGEEGLDFLLRLMRSRLTQLLGVDPMIVGLLPDGSSASIAVAARMPCDAITGYGLLPDWSGPPVQDYATLIEQRVAEWYRIQDRIDVPFLPVVCVGWDASRRGEYIVDIRQASSFPWRPIISGGTPDLFKSFIAEGRRFLDLTNAPYRVVYIHAWNEWSEGSSVEPGHRFGSQYLHAIQQTVHL